MSAAALDRLLAILVAALLATGLLSLRAGTPPTAPLFAVHGILAGALALTMVAKLRRSAPRAVAARRWGALALALLVALLATAALVLGFAWVISGRILAVGPWTVLTLHAWAALALLPLVAIHLLPRRWRVLRPAPRRAGQAAMSRRAMLGIAGMTAVGLLGWLGANALDMLAGGARRFTGSRRLPDGGVPPVTTFFGESAPRIDVAAWRLTVHGAVARPLQLTAADLVALGDVETVALLDCTSGWALRTSWRGTPLAAVLDAAGASSGGPVTIRSVTGWNASLGWEEARGAMLARGVAGAPLATGNGAPCRLVAPERRGLEWVKWVNEIEVS
jgi:hypothetical protein